MMRACKKKAGSYVRTTLFASYVTPPTHTPLVVTTSKLFNIF